MPMPPQQPLLGTNPFEYQHVTLRPKRKALPQTAQMKELEEQEKQIAARQMQRDTNRLEAEERHRKELEQMQKEEIEEAELAEQLRQRRKTVQEQEELAQSKQAPLIAVQSEDQLRCTNFRKYLYNRCSNKQKRCRDNNWKCRKIFLQLCVTCSRHFCLSSGLKECSFRR